MNIVSHRRQTWDIYTILVSWSTEVEPTELTHGDRYMEALEAQRSIYDLKQAFQSWNIRFDKVIRGYDFIKNESDPCVYKISGSSVAYLVLYVEDILLIGNDVEMLGHTKAWLST
ncbi:UNVERIFIED_CONTAM: hypothetical protein Slati_0168900 [Sesamum latifolium]|uniref:Reverse transcriptase Ty1/copia-type domain-containing protein n=1 Tax=Sesamum latifolium TaxID=2727402 RepID=A0AAW2YAP0_9LAMI